jgi:membrane associated rhomboid family serine protease
LQEINQQSSLRTCPGCGNPTPADSPLCAHCGLNSVEAILAHRKLASEHRFLEALFTRSNPFTMILIGANVGVYVLMCLAGGLAITGVDHAVLIGFGAKQNELIAGQHQYWRLVTSMFIHIGIIHLLLNNYALWIIGQEIERIYGSARFVFLYLITGVLGSLGSYAFNPQATSAGASGAIFGLFGVMATFAFKYRKEIPETLSREIKRRVLPIIALNLVFGLSVQIVDNAAHIGGLLSGVALALIVPYKRPGERITPLAWRSLQAICLIVMFASFVGAFRNYNGPRLGISNLMQKPGSSVVIYFDGMKDAGRALGESLQSFSTVLDNRSETETLRSAADAVDRGLHAARSIPKLDTRADGYRDQLIELLVEQKRILDEFASANPRNWKAAEREEESLILRHNKFVSEYGEWLPGYMKEHGYELREEKDH